MAANFSTGFRNALLDGTDMTNLFDAGTLDIYSGTKPTDADTTEGAGTLLASVAIPTPGFAAAAGSGQIAKAGTWQDTSANAAGTAAWFRLRESGDGGGASTTAKRIDGTVTATGGGGEIEISSVSIGLADPITIDTFVVSITA